MRPRRIAAEYKLVDAWNGEHTPGFNEAAANRRGIPVNGMTKPSIDPGFNEAAANRRGILERELSSHHPHQWLQ